MKNSAVAKVLILSLVAICHHGRATHTVPLDEDELNEEDYQVFYVEEDIPPEPPRIKAHPSKQNNRRASEEDESPQTPANDRVFFPPYKMPFWGMPYGIYSNGGFVNPGLFPFVPGGPGFPPYDGIFGGPFGPGAFPGPGLNPFGPGVGTPMGVPTPGLPGGPPPPGLPQQPSTAVPAPAPPTQQAPGGGAVATKSKAKPKPKPKRKPKPTPAPYTKSAENCGCTKHHPPTTPHSYHYHKSTTAAPCPLKHDYTEATSTAAPYYPPSSSTTPAPEYTTASTTTAAPYYPAPPPPQHQIQQYYPVPSSPTMAPIIMMYTPSPNYSGYRRSHNLASPPSPSKKPCPYRLRAELALQSLHQQVQAQPSYSTPSTTTTPRPPIPPPPSSSPQPSKQQASLYFLNPHFPSTYSSSLLYPSSQNTLQSPPAPSPDSYVLIDQDELEELQRISLDVISSSPKAQRRRNSPGNRKRDKKKLLSFDTYLDSSAPEN